MTNTVKIGKIIQNLKEKAGGVDGISAKTLKIIAPFISESLQHIWERPAETGRPARAVPFSRTWRSA